MTHSALLDLGLLPFSVLSILSASRPLSLSLSHITLQSIYTHRCRTLELISHPQQLRHVFSKSQLFQRFGNVLTRNRLLGILLRNFVCLARQHRDELYAALDQDVAGVFREGHVVTAAIVEGGIRSEDFVDDLLDGGWRNSVSIALGRLAEVGCRSSSDHHVGSLEWCCLDMWRVLHTFWKREVIIACELHMLEPAREGKVSKVALILATFVVIHTSEFLVGHLGRLGEADWRVKVWIQ